MLRFHWLNVEQRIIFKVILIIFKCINNIAPVPLINCLQLNTHSRGILKLNVNLFNASTTNGHKSFSFYAPRLWNNLPDNLLIIEDINDFKKALKTFLFSNYYFYKSQVNRIITII